MTPVFIYCRVKNVSRQLSAPIVHQKSNRVEDETAFIKLFTCYQAMFLFTSLIEYAVDDDFNVFTLRTSISNGCVMTHDFYIVLPPFLD